MTSALDQWNDRHLISKEEVDLSQWSLSKEDQTTASKMRRERQLAIRSAVLKANGDMANGDMGDNDEDEGVPPPKKKIKGKGDTSGK